MRFSETFKLFFGAAALCVALAGAACQQEAVTNTNTTTTTVANVNSSNTANVSVTTQTTASGVVIETKEPEKYTATMSVTAAPTGQQAQALPEIKIARNGADRRYSLDTRIPGVGEVIFLDKADKRYVILPARKQYLELTPEMTGFEVPRSLTPGQLVAQLEKQQGVERVGEETLNGRQAIKYRYAAKANTGTQAGQVAADSFIFIDKETGLPLRIEGYGQSTGNVQGISGGKATVEMRNLTTDVNTADFEIPQGFAKLTQEQVQQQTKVILAGVQFFLNAFNAQQQQGGAAPATTATPASSASPARTP
ncbi:MAG: hypothetical protein LC754_05825 [Acidobacteria bacterium]|nr:hypothetical protein [Acidobacteriota bacterium]